MQAAVLLAHGNNDNNVMTKNATAFYEAVKRAGPPAPVLLPPGRPRRRAAGRDGQPLVHAYLYGVKNGVETPAEVVGGARGGGLPAAPERRSSARQANTATLTVADASPFPLGFTLTVPQTNANGTITNTTRVITDIPANMLTLATAVATGAGQRSPTARSSNLVCGNANPTPYAEWPDPTAAAGHAEADRPARPARGGLTLRRRLRRAGDAHRQRARSRRRPR